MSETLFISDLHLCDERPHTVALFCHFTETRARRAAHLYILGDLFEVWIGNDDPSHTNRLVERSLRELVIHGTRVYFMHGNRDFLITHDFAARTGCELIADPTRIELYGTSTLLAHGDSLCTDDHAHQTYRAIAYRDDWKQNMLARPLQERLGLARRYRQASEAGKERKASEIMDVNQRSVEDFLRAQEVRRLIHGHTHRPAVHNFQLDGRPAQRFVLAEWNHQGAVLCWNRHGYWIEKVVAPVMRKRA